MTDLLAITAKTESIMRNTFIFLVPAIFVGTASMAYSGETGRASSLSQYLDVAIAHDASIAAARHRWESLRSRVPAAGTWPDPELAYGYFFSPVETRVGAQNQKLGLFQKIPWPKRLSEQRSHAEARAEAVWYEYLATMRERVSAAKAAWIRLASLDARIDVLGRQLSLVEEALTTLDSHLASGRAALADRSLMRQQLTRLEARLLALHGGRESALAVVRRFASDVDGVYAPSLEALETRPLPGRARLVRALLDNSEPLLARSAEVRAAERAREVARLEGYPDITLGVEYTQVNDSTFATPPDNGQDAIMGSIRISLPIWRDKYDAIERSARHALAAAAARERATRDDLIENLGQAHARAVALARQVRLYENQLLPQTRETFEATLAGFGSGRRDALRWIEAQRDLLDAEMGRVRLAGEALLAITEIERIAAIELIRSQTPPPSQES